MTDATRTRGGVGEAPDYATMTGPEVLVALDKALARAEKAEARLSRGQSRIASKAERMLRRRADLRARVRELEDGLRALRLTAQRWDDSFDGEIVAGIDALLAAPEPPAKEPKA